MDAFQDDYSSLSSTRLLSEYLSKFKEIPAVTTTTLTYYSCCCLDINSPRFLFFPALWCGLDDAILVF